MAKNILVGVTGGIAAYKSVELIRLLREAGHCVRVVMTQHAAAFVTPFCFQVISGNPAHSALMDEIASNGMRHIELAKWADIILIAPASANTIAKIAHASYCKKRLLAKKRLFSHPIPQSIRFKNKHFLSQNPLFSLRATKCKQTLIS